MKVGIQKVHENEWLVQIGCAIMRLDRFSVELLDITLEHMLALAHGEQHSTFNSYLKLGTKLKQLSPSDIQVVTREVDNHDMVVLLGYAKDQELTDKVFNNVGGILAKQMEKDLLNNPLPEGREARDCVRRVVEKLFLLDSQGKIEFIDENTQYI